MHVNLPDRSCKFFTARAKNLVRCASWDGIKHHDAAAKTVLLSRILIHPWKLTWNPKMKVWKMSFLFKQVIFRFHVKFQGCTGLLNNPYINWVGFHPRKNTQQTTRGPYFSLLTCCALWAIGLPTFIQKMTIGSGISLGPDLLQLMSLGSMVRISGLQPRYAPIFK